jgi:hypothetical protein
VGVQHGSSESSMSSEESLVADCKGIAWKQGEIGMFRKSIFLGMMVLLGAVLVSLVLSGRKEEQRQAAAPTEIVKTAKATATRSMVPEDLDVGESRVELTAADRNQKHTAEPQARCRLVIRNHGRIAYHDLVLKLQCLGSSGKHLGQLTQLVPETIQPGQVLTIPEVLIDKLPAGTAKCTLSVLYANLGSAPAR